MDDLGETLKATLAKMKGHRSLYEQNEMAVRDQIVSPILEGLGWNPRDPEEVQPNITSEEGIPDYTLLKDGKKALLVETKRLSIDVERKEVVSQLGKYCFGEGVKYGILTNGAIWILFRSFQEDTTMTERIVWRTDIEKDELTAVTRRLDTVSKGNVLRLESVAKKLQILDEIWNMLLDEPGDIVRAVRDPFDWFLMKGYPDYKFQVGEISDFIQERLKRVVTPIKDLDVGPISGSQPWEGTRPRRMKIDGEIFEVRHPYEFLVNAAEWLIKKGKLGQDNCPVPIGTKRYLVNIEPKHRYGDNFRAPRRLSNGLHIETHYSVAGCIRNAERLLNRLTDHRARYDFEDDVNRFDAS